LFLPHLGNRFDAETFDQTTFSKMTWNQVHETNNGRISCDILFKYWHVDISIEQCILDTNAGKQQSLAATDV
jgi:hypothetical protein